MNGRHAADGGFGRSTADTAVRGVLLVAVAAVLGTLLLWRANDGGATATISTSSETTTTVASNGATTTTTARPGATTTTAAPPGATTTAAPAAGVHKPAEVTVLVANGTGTPSGAGNVSNRLKPKGYTVLAAADASSANIAKSVIYYREGYAEDAKQIARDVGITGAVESKIEAMPANPPVKANAAQRAADAKVLVILGTDGVIKQTA